MIRALVNGALAVRALGVVFTLAALAIPVSAQEGPMSVTVTPTLFQLTVGPGESWSSSVKVVNNNDRDVTYYANVLDFTASGEEGAAKYIPLVGEAAKSPQPYSLASWVKIPQVPMTIKAGKSQNIPFSLHVPENAEPGGHYAAILVGTKSSGLTSGSGASVSSFVSSLLFVRIRGEVIENGRIREFSTKRDLYEDPKSDFVLRFENLGNTHLHPEGDVTIYNMWGKERGSVAINQEDNFGNVLPKSVRKFQFSWEGESNPFDIGPYSAVVTLAYGENGRKNVVAKTYFWVVPTVPVAITLGILLLFILTLSWFIRRYIRRALELERARYGSLPIEAASSASSIQALLEPIREGVVDLRAVRTQAPTQSSRVETSAPSVSLPQASITKAEFFQKYRLFFGFVVLVIISTIAAWFYFERALTQHRAYKIQMITSEVEELSSQ